LDVVFDRLRRLGVARTTHGRMAGGVCAGLARRWGVAPIAVRAGFVALMILGGAGLLAYLVVLALLPDERGVILAEQAVRRGDGSAIFLLVIIGLLLAGELSDRWWVWAAIPLAVAAWWVVRGAATGKSPAQLGREVQDGATGMARTMRAWTAPGHRAAPSGVPEAASSPTTAAIPTPPADSPWAGLPQDRPAGMPSSPAPFSQPPGSPVPGAAPTSTPSPAGWTAPAAWPAPAAAVAPHGMGPGRTWAPGVQAKAPVIREKRRRGGFPVFVIAIGLGAATFGALGSVESVFTRVAHPWSFIVIAGCAVAALVLIVAALRGMRASFTAFVVTSALVLASASALVPAPFSLHDGAGERLWRPVATGSTAAGESAAYALGLGSATLDLGQVTADANGYPVKVSLGVGELVIDVPDGITVHVDLSVGTGEVSAEDHRGSKNAVLVGTGGGLVFRIGTGEPDVVIKASVGVGSVVIRSDTQPVLEDRSRS